MKRGNIAFIIEDTKGNVFGCYIENRIIREYCFVNDPNAFVFSLKSNGRLSQPTKFNIKPKRRNKAFTLFKNDWNVLFTLGNDIYIGKSNSKHQCLCVGNGYEYGEKTDVLVGKCGEDNEFTVKRIQVWQMYEDEEQKKIREEQESAKERNGYYGKWTKCRNWKNNFY